MVTGQLILGFENNALQDIFIWRFHPQPNQGQRSATRLLARDKKGAFRGHRTETFDQSLLVDGATGNLLGPCMTIRPRGTNVGVYQTAATFRR